MNKIISLLILCFLFSTISSAQYTGVINSSKPGNTQTPFSVGTNVYQIENTLLFGNFKQNNVDNKAVKNDFNFRYGFWKEQLEASLIHKFRSNIDNNTSGTEILAIGAKYLVYNHKPKNTDEAKSSWKKRNSFVRNGLIPSVAVSAHYNTPLNSDKVSNIGSSFSTAIITQNHITRDFRVNNQFEYNYIGSDLPEFIYTLSASHVVLRRFNPYAEFSYHNTDAFSYFNTGIGVPFLVNRNFAIAAQYNVNFGDNISGSEFGISASYRFDKHYDKWVDKSQKVNLKWTWLNNMMDKVFNRKKKEKAKPVKKQKNKSQKADYLDEILDPKAQAKARKREAKERKKEEKRALKAKEKEEKTASNATDPKAIEKAERRAAKKKEKADKKALKAKAKEEKELKKKQEKEEEERLRREEEYKRDPFSILRY